MEFRFSKSVGTLTSSAVRDILKLTQGQEIISFAGGLPAEELFPLEAVRAAADRVFALGHKTLQYGVTEGHVPLREQLCVRMAAKSMDVHPEQMLLTTGSQQAIDLVARVLTEPGDVVLVESPTYLASLQVFRMYGLRVVSVDSDAHGMLIDEAERLMQTLNPRLVYVVPTFGNPTGRTWSTERRKGLVALSQRYGVPVIEDDPYGDIRFDEQLQVPTLMSMQPTVDGGGVIYLGSFSKTVAPALRTGWAIADREVVRMMAKAKQAADLHSSMLDQQTLDQLLQVFPLDDHIRHVSSAYASRMQAMQKELESRGRGDLSWQEPLGGMFLWLELPEALDAQTLLRAAVLKGVAFVPGTSFFAEKPKRNTARLNFTHTGGERMRQGIARLFEAMDEFLARC
ncbi:PLP-dependent aminotransferase family protein [Paenibacillus sp. IB182496]|uniref:PLP-dependent aminotransferase family protein n=1 Tax=Paenibacillus sabuli TaxID=2772509 RepID=A0A927BT14_9BACL|nr:PLP-dependent aminotransferase family protein [Paenibacillus sabuli]MBD2845767.1 PLP-dependent aminotransferase family protein [Paenibacillus sabuli]